MDDVAEECWTRIESLRHRVRSICLEVDKMECASIDAEFAELREFVFASLRAQEGAAPTRR